MADVTIRAVRTNELLEFYEKAAWGYGVRPINALRAKAQAHNPHADPQDVVLLAAFEGGRCVGYLGLVPSLALVGGGGRAKVYWLSAWFVEPGARATSAGALLLLRAMGLGYDLFACGMSRYSLAALKAMRFSEMKPLSFDRLVLDRQIAAATAPLRAARRAIRVLGGNVHMAHRAIDLARTRLKFLKGPLWMRMAASVGEHPARFIPVDRVRSSLIPEAEQTGCLYRGVETVNWMLSFPWVPIGEDRSDRDYHFLARRDLHQYLVFQSVDGETAVGGYVTMLLSREFGVTSLRLLDVTPSASSVRDVAALVLSVGRRHNADIMEMPTQVGEIFAEVKGVAGLKERVVFPCMYRLASRSSPLCGIINQVQPRLTDGDLPFA